MQYSTDGVHFSNLGSVAGTATSCTVSGTNSRTIYTFRVQAVGSNGATSPYSNPVSIRP